jgi:hypothetical protein
LLRVDPEPRFLTPSLKTGLGAAERVKLGKEPLLQPDLETPLKLIKRLPKNSFHIDKELRYQLGVYKRIQECIVLTNQI